MTPPPKKKYERKEKKRTSDKVNLKLIKLNLNIQFLHTQVLQE